MGVSIHAPVKVRLKYLEKCQPAPTVSIHAPVKVRPLFLAVSSFALSFNSRTREGATCTGHSLCGG